MGNFLRYLCGIALVLGILLVPTGDADSETDPAVQYQQATVVQPETPAAARPEAAEAPYGKVAAMAVR